MLDQKGFDDFADEYEAFVAQSEEAGTYPFAGYHAVHQTIVDRATAKSAAKVLDVGFGTAALTSRLYERGCEIWGQDFSERMREIAGQKMPKARLYAGDVANGLAPEICAQRFDFVISTYAFHHLTIERQISFLQEALNLLSDDGEVLIGDVSFEDAASRARCKATAGDAFDDDENYFIFEELRKTFPQAIYEKKSDCAGVLQLKTSLYK